MMDDKIFKILDDCENNNLYDKAIDIINKELEVEIDDYNYENELKRRKAEFLYERRIFQEIGYGEAFLPVVNTENKRSILIKVKIIKKEVSSKEKYLQSWEIVKKLVFDYLHDMVAKEELDFYLIGLNLQNIYFKFSVNNNKEIEGKSFELALAIALLSYIINLKPNCKCALTGKIATNSNNKFMLEAVDYIEEKIQILQDYQFIEKLVVVDTNIEDSKIINVQKFDEVIKEIFDYEKVKNKIRGLHDSQCVNTIKYTIDDIRLKKCNNKKIKAKRITIEHSMIDENQVKYVNEFYSKLVEKISKLKSPVLIDKAVAGFENSFIVLHALNKPIEFLAINNTNFSKAIVVYRQLTNNDISVGDLLEIDN